MGRNFAELTWRIVAVIILCYIAGMFFGCVPVDWGAPAPAVSPATGNVKGTTVSVGLVIFLVSLWFWTAKCDMK